MNTPSHIFIAAALLKKADARLLPRSAFLVGSFMPDISLGILSLAATFYYRVLLGNQSPDLMETVLHPLYFNNPYWISAHNFLHAPLALGLYLAALWPWRNQAGNWQNWLFWFFASCGLHSLGDILTHFDDGPVLFWPLNWQFRFHSPVSYWDKAHYGSQFFYFEIGLNLLLLGYLLIPWMVKYFRKSPS